MIDEVCAQICSMGCDWIDIKIVLDILKRKFCLTNEETEIIFNFLAKYFLEVDESGKKVRPVKELCNLYKED